MENTKAITIREHKCKAIQNQNIIEIKKIKLPGDSTPRWFFSFNDQLNEIRFCPYCSQVLDASEDAALNPNLTIQQVLMDALFWCKDYVRYLNDEHPDGVWCSKQVMEADIAAIEQVLARIK
jgi:hypothetical protein